MRRRTIFPTLLAAATLSVAVVLAAALTAEGQVRDDDPHVLVVPDTPGATSALADSAARVIARYESFTLVEASGDDALRLVRVGADVRDDMRAVRLRGQRVDPARERPRLVGRGRRPRATGLALVQFAGPVKDAWLGRVRGAGVRVVGYSAQNSYLVHGSAAQLQRLGELAGRDAALRAAIPVEPGDKLDVGVATTGRQSLAVQTLSGQDGDAARAAVERLGRTVRPSSSLGSLRTQFVQLDGADVPALAADPGVVAIEPYVVPELRDERAAQIVAGNLSGTSPTGPGYLSFLAGEGFGSATFDFVIDVTDEGVDKGVLPPPAGSHPDLFESGSVSNPTRIAYQNDYTVDTNARDCGGHGTNVASIAAGFSDAAGATGTTAVEDASGFNYGLGVAPRAKLGASKIFRCSDGAFDVAGSLTNLTAAAYTAGARVSNNSWGADTGGAYNSDSQEYDSLVRDAQPSVAGNQEIVEVFAAGNAGSGTNTIGAPGTAKNVIAVGASENVRPAGTDGCGVTDSEANSANDIIDFSSRGPTDDLRTKPDVIAPGTHVTGASPQVGGDYNGSGTCNPQFPAGNTLYSLVSGTSQATPEASGMAALVRDWYRREHGGGSTPPSPAMTKAIMVNTATDVAGGSNGKGGTTASVPNGDQGWGRINLGSALDSTTRSFWDQKIVLRETGEGVARSYAIVNGSKPLKITLAWTDPPGPTVGNAFVSDLNLVVEAGGTTYKGNVFSGGQSVAGGTADARNNVENVYLPAGTSGPVEVSVVAANLAADGVPGAGDATDQDFALVVSNGSEQPAPLLTHEATSISDPAGDGDSILEPGEPFSLQEILRNSGTAAATSVSGSLSAITSGVTVTDGIAAFPNLSAGATGANTDALTASVAGAVPCGTDMRMTLDITTAQGAFAVPISIPTGSASAPASLNSTDIPKTIPTNRRDTITSNLTVAAAGLIKDLDVRIGSLTHTWVGDLRISLIAPDGTSVVLTDRPGGLDNSGDNFANTVFDDEASASINAGSPPYTGRFRPNADQLSRFDGKQQQGTWVLRVEDLFAADGGSLQSWGTDTQTAQCSTSADTTPPNVTLTTPAHSSATSDTTPVLSGGAGTAAGDSSTVTVKIWSGSAASGTLLHTLTTTRSGGSWSTIPPALAEGTYTVRAEQSDSASNTGVSSANTFRVDTTAPAVTLTSPADGSFTSDTTPSLAGAAGSATGDSGTVTVKIWSGVGNTSGTPLHTLTTTRSSGSWSTTGPTLADGAYTVRAEQADDAGNTGTSAARSFTVDTTAPAVTLTSPADGALISDSTPVLSGAAGTAAGDANNLTVKVWTGTSASGAPVRTITLASVGSSWSGEITPALADGQYTARAEQADLAGNTGTSATRTFTISTGTPDTTPPHVTVTSPANGSATNDTTPALAGGAGTATGDSATVTVKIWSGSSVSGTPLHTVTTTHSDGSWSATAPTLAVGTYTARAEQSDAATNTGVSSANTFRVDTTAPTVTLTSPAEGAFTSDTTPAASGVAGTAVGDSNDVTVKVWAGTSTSGSPVRTLIVVGSSGSWSTDVTPALAEGQYTARAEQQDTAGNAGTSATRTFTVDTTPPAVTLTSPAEGALTNDSTPAVSGAAGAAAGDSSELTVKVWAGMGTSGSPVRTLMVPTSGGSWSAEVSPALADGVYTARAEQQDTAGNTGISGTRTFTVEASAPDTTTPNITLTSPVGGSATNDTTPALSGGAGTDAGDLASVTVKIWSGALASGTPLHTLTTTGSGGSWSATAPALAEGTYTARAEQSDSAGNTGVSSANTFRVDTTAPEVTLTRPADGAFTSDATPAATGAAGTAVGDSNDVTVKVWAGTSAAGAPVRTIAVASVGSSWSAEITPALADGQYTARAEQQDTAGNTGTGATRTFTIDTDPPEATITAGPSGTVGSSDAVFEFSSNEPDGAAFECSLTGASFSACSSGKSYSSLADGEHRFEVLAIDRAGNRGSPAVREWTVSSPTPIVPASPGELPADPLLVPAGAAPQVMPLEGSLGDVLRGGVVAQFACHAACRADGALLLSARAARQLGLAGPARSVVVGRASRRLDAAGAAALTVKLTRRARRALARASSARLVLRLTVTEQTGERSTRRVALTLRRLDMADRLRRGLRLSVGCAESCRAAAALRVARTTARRLRLARTVIARGSLTLASAGNGRLIVRFTREARRRLSGASLVPARLTVVVSASGEDVTFARRLDLRD